MRRLLFPIFIITVLSAYTYSNAQSCKVDAISLKARVQADPDSVLYSLGDAIALQPHCMADLIEAAILGSNPDDDTLTQIIKLAVTEYPLESGTIAEAAVLAAPEKVDVIRLAFIPAPEPAVEDKPENKSPIENFLNNYQPPAEPLVAEPVDLPEEPQIELLQGDMEVKTAKAKDPDDVAMTALNAIDELLAKLKNEEGCLISDDDPEIKSSISGDSIETFRLNFTDDRIAITTFNDHMHFDMTEEFLEYEVTEPLIINDPVVKTDLVEYLKETIREDEPVKPATAPKEDVAFTSSVYPIPSASEVIEPNGTEITTPAIRGATVSPTLPRGR